MLNNVEICKLIPHNGKMCLIDSVEKYNDKNIACKSWTHLDSDNPLYNNNVLPVCSLIEYGAQVMAIHGALLAQDTNEKMYKGYLATLRNVKFNIGSMKNINSYLLIKATQQLASQGNMIYDFSVASDNNILITGRATVVAVLKEEV